MDHLKLVLNTSTLTCMKKFDINLVVCHKLIHHKFIMFTNCFLLLTTSFAHITWKIYLRSFVWIWRLICKGYNLKWSTTTNSTESAHIIKFQFPGGTKSVSTNCLGIYAFCGHPFLEPVEFWRTLLPTTSTTHYCRTHFSTTHRNSCFRSIMTDFLFLFRTRLQKLQSTKW